MLHKSVVSPKLSASVVAPSFGEIQSSVIILRFKVAIELYVTIFGVDAKERIPPQRFYPPQPCYSRHSFGLCTHRAGP